MPELTVIIPTYNEESAVSDSIGILIPVAREKGWRILVVNDGSTDRTGEVLADIDGITVLTHPYNKGYGASLKTGIRAAETDLVAFYDADGQHDPGDLVRMLDQMGDFDMVVGERGKDSYQQWLRKPGKWLLSKIANILASRKIPDLNSGLRILKREIIEKMLHLMPDGFSFSTTTTIAFLNMGFSVLYQPIKVKRRVGKSSVRQLKHGSSAVLLILRLIVLFNPLKIFLPVSFYLFLIGMVYEILYGIILFPDGVRLIPAALFMLLSSVLIFFFGLVVDQISELRKYINLR